MAGGLYFLCMRHAIGISFIAVSLLLFLPPSAAAQTMMTRQQDLAFGLFSIRNNNAQHSLIVDINGNVSAAPAYILSTPGPQNGEIFLEGLTANVPFSVTFDNGTMSLDGLGNPPLFNIINFTTNGPFTTSPTGTLDILVGATLRSSGSMVNYPSGSYLGSYDITLDY